MRLSDFLANNPPGTEEQIDELFANNYHPGNTTLKVSSPDIKLHCGNNECEGVRYFRSTSIQEAKFDVFKKHIDIHLHYRCRNCDKNTKTFALRVAREDSSSFNGRAIKFGEIPSYGPPIPSRVISLIGPDRDMFLSGRRAENQGLGIGAFAYYRRVVENQKGRLIENIGEVAKRLGASEETLNIFEKASEETQFSKAVESIKPVLPSVLLINGHNPLTLLHSALSEGLHEKTEKQCLELAVSVRVVLTELSDRISIALKDEAEVKHALKTLMNRKPS